MTQEQKPSERSIKIAEQAWCTIENDAKKIDTQLTLAFARILDNILSLQETENTNIVNIKTQSMIVKQNMLLHFRGIEKDKWNIYNLTFRNMNEFLNEVLKLCDMCEEKEADHKIEFNKPICIHRETSTEIPISINKETK